MCFATCVTRPETGADGCKSDRECKLARICEAARCVWPHAPDSSGHGGARTADADVSKPGKQDGAGGANFSPNGIDGKNSPDAPAVAPSQAMFRLGRTHRGLTPYRIPLHQPTVRWAHKTRGAITSSPTLIPGGGVIFGSHDGRVHALGADGTARWTHTTGDLVFSSPALALAAVPRPAAADASSPASTPAVAYVGSDDDHLYAINLKTGTVLWKFRIGSCSAAVAVGRDASRCDVDAGPTLGPDGTIYTGGDGIYAINPDGTLRWRFATGGHVSSAPAILPDGTVVAGCQDNLIYAITPSGTKRWDFRAGDDVEASPAVARDGTVYIGADDGKLYALSQEGDLRWAFTVGDDVRASAAIGDNGTIYVGAFNALFYAIRPDGTLSWTFRAADRILSSALVDSTGATLFGAEDDRLYALEPDGKLRWSVALGGDIDSSPALSSDGTIYVGSDDGNLTALRAPEK